MKPPEKQAFQPLASWPHWRRVAVAAVVVFLASLTAIQSARAAEDAKKTLPEDVKAMRAAILDAAETGNIEAIRIPIELNELPPEIDGTGSADGDAVAAIANLSPASGGKAALAGIVNVLQLAASEEDGVFIWPYLATRDLKTLTPREQVDLHRLVPEPAAKAMMETGIYAFYQLEIGRDGTWHSLGIGGRSR